MKHILNSIVGACILCALLGTIVTSCSTANSKNIGGNSATEHKTPKYIFYFIGDGMSFSQINLAETMFNKSVAPEDSGSMNIRKFPVTGMQTTNAENRFITGSAAAATALATGNKTYIGHISVKHDGTRLKTMAELAKEKGMKVGIVSSVSIDHATPAGFYAHVDDRDKYYEIGQDLLKSGFDYFAGGNVRYNKYSRKDYSFDDFLADAEKAGYKYVNTKAALDSLQTNQKAIASIKKLRTSTPDGCALPYAIDLDEETDKDNQITLADFTQKGIDLLSANEKGFFMMIESGKIDWACHANDAVSALNEALVLDRAIGKALAFYEQHPDETLIVITGDHETGGLTLGYVATEYNSALELLQHQNVSFLALKKTVKQWKKNGNQTFEGALKILAEKVGLGGSDARLALSEVELSRLKTAFEKSMDKKYDSDHPATNDKLNYGEYDPFSVTAIHILNNKAGIDFTSFKHTAVPVPVFALGQGQAAFSGYYDNTDIAKRIIKVAKLQQ